MYHADRRSTVDSTNHSSLMYNDGLVPLGYLHPVVLSSWPVHAGSVGKGWVDSDEVVSLIPGVAGSCFGP